MLHNKNAHLKKVLVDFKKLNDYILNLLVVRYPHGYSDNDIIAFKNSKNELVECVEVFDEETLFLVKISTQLESKMDNFDLDDDDRLFGNDDPPEFDV